MPSPRCCCSSLFCLRWRRFSFSVADCSAADSAPLHAVMNRRHFIHRTFSAAATVSLAGCGGGPDAKETLNAFLWAEYLPDDVVRDFEKEAGCRVQVDTYNSNEEMMAKVATGKSGY